MKPFFAVLGLTAALGGPLAAADPLMLVSDQALDSLRGRYIDAGQITHFGVQLVSILRDSTGNSVGSAVVLQGVPGNLPTVTRYTLDNSSGNAGTTGASTTGGISSIQGVAQVNQVAGQANAVGNQASVQIRVDGSTAATMPGSGWSVATTGGSAVSNGALSLNLSLGNAARLTQQIGGGQLLQQTQINGNGYTAEWEAEAAKRGLPNKKNTPAALPALVEPKNIQLMEEFGVLTKVEMESRYEVEMEHYSKIINIEALTMLEMARKQLLPAINAYMSEVANTAASKLAVSEAISVRSETKTLTRLSTDADAMSDAIDALQAAVDTAEAMTDESAKAVSFHDDVLPRMDALRAAADDAETICGEDYWPLPSYSKMLYYV